MLTDEQYNERLEYAKTHAPEEYASKFGLKLNTAVAFYYSHKIGTKHKKHARKDEFCAYALEHTKDETAAEFGICKRTVSNLEKLYGVKCARKKNILNERNISICEYADSHTLVETAIKFGITKQRVFQIREAVIEKKKHSSC